MTAPPSIRPEDLRVPVHRGWITACIILFWPLAIAAVLAANRAAGALGAGDVWTAQREAHRARNRARLGVLIGGALYAGTLMLYVPLGLILTPMATDSLKAEGIDTAAAEPAPGSYRTAAAPKREPITIDPLTARAGDCFMAPDWETAWGWVDVIPCSRLHDAQVIAVTDLGDGEFPGTSEVSDWAWYDCAPRYEEYSGASLSADSPVWTIEPTWDDWGDGLRRAVCFVQVDTPMRGELADYPGLFEVGASS
ncbi:septum formation family protein [Promicromonospora sukumoe]|uniref:septum formation family protein n=1 Tax=Promicromonospora sukumoe TaxID=88382 RepID=UPI0012FCEFD8|nr:septum formation family protein [Promicromonospora sukumoe]